jgi:hypothetical protein
MESEILKNIALRLSLCVVIFLFPLLGRELGGGCLLAQNGNGITLSNFTATPDASATTLTIDVQWKPLTNGKVWSDTVWVFVDYNHAGTMTRLPLAPGATLTNPSWSGASVIEVENNPHGVWVAGNAREAGSFSATVQMVSTCRDARQCVPTGACVYAINYPPKADYTAYNQIKFAGTPPFALTLSDGSTPEVKRENAGHTYTYTLPSGQILLKFSDASGAPGVITCKQPAAQTLTASASSYCAGSSGATLSLSGTEAGVVYQLYRNGSSLGAGATLTGTGSERPFPGTYQAGAYTVQTAAGSVCPRLMSGAPVVTIYPTPEPPVITGAGTACFSATLTATPGNYGDRILWDDGSTASVRVVDASATYRATSVYTALGCTGSATAADVQIFEPSADGQPVSPCGCADGTTDCSGTCRTNGTFTRNDGACTGACNTAYVRSFNQCGTLLNARYGSYSNSSCTSGCCYYETLERTISGRSAGCDAPSICAGVRDRLRPAYTVTNSSCSYWQTSYSTPKTYQANYTCQLRICY